MPMDDNPDPSASEVEDELYAEEPGPSSELADALNPTDEHYAVFDPEAIGVASNYSGEEGQSETETPDDPEGFDARWREDFEGLLYLGHLSKKFVWMGHEFVIRTTTTDEALQIAAVHKPYVGSLGEVKAYQAAVVAASIVSVDGTPLPLPVTSDVDDTLLHARFRYVTTRWVPVIMDVVYNQCLALENRVNEILVKMGKAHG